MIDFRFSKNNLIKKFNKNNLDKYNNFLVTYFMSNFFSFFISAYLVNTVDISVTQYAPRGGCRSDLPHHTFILNTHSFQKK